MRDTSAQLMPLPDGRKLSFAEYGDRIGQPMIYCHGWPSSRFEALLADDAAAAVGVRLIAIDRPGQVGRTTCPDAGWWTGRTM